MDDKVLQDLKEELIDEFQFSDFVAHRVADILTRDEEAWTKKDMLMLEYAVDLIVSTTNPKDAKLSTKQRNRLKSSTFCGPNRSFPVPDCAHYVAALRLLNRYKGPGDKSKIRACIMRRGRQLGCKGASTSKK